MSLSWAPWLCRALRRRFMSVLAAETASRTLGFVAVTPRLIWAWFGVALPIPTPTTVIVLPDADAASVSTCGGGPLTVVGRDTLIASAVTLAAATAIRTPQTTSRRVCADIICQLQRLAGLRVTGAVPRRCLRRPSRDLVTGL